MTDLEMTKLCAEAMGLEGYVEERLATSLGQTRLCRPEMDRPKDLPEFYRPLWDDAQAMKLVKEFNLDLSWGPGEQVWRASQWLGNTPPSKARSFLSKSPDLNRAIVECVAKMQKGKQS